MMNDEGTYASLVSPRKGKKNLFSDKKEKGKGKEW